MWAELMDLENACTHEEGPLSEGEVLGHEVTCPWHGAKFDIRTGEVLGPPAYEANALQRARHGNRHRGRAIATSVKRANRGATVSKSVAVAAQGRCGSDSTHNGPRRPSSLRPKASGSVCVTMTSTRAHQVRKPPPVVTWKGRSGVRRRIPDHRALSPSPVPQGRRRSKLSWLT
jgi:nitrite reductase/ring-hydroxylating ferredoxin subunit